MPTKPYGASINVTQAHSLGVEEAVARLSKGDKPTLLAVLSSMIATTKLTKVTAELEADVPGENIPLTVVITADRVTVESGSVGRFVEVVGESAIGAKLAEALKP